VREREVANDEGTVSVAEALLLLEEINRLKAKIDEYEDRLAELDGLAHSDPLVGLPNRRSFLVKLQRLIRSVEEHNIPAAVMLADLDGLKSINDTFGHAAGDDALVEVSRLLVASVRKSDCVSRLGGDEFGILLFEAEELSAWQLALRVVETVDDHQFCVNQVCVPLSVAVGVAAIQRGDTPGSVLERADREMYRIKRLKPSLARS
jgi:diguanylate cyclase (GGDEF)-like protein